MRRNVVIFDIDRTLVKRDLHSLIIEAWATGRTHRFLLNLVFSVFHRSIPLSYVKRKLEYIVVEFIDEEFIRAESARLIADGAATNQALIRRIGRYQSWNFEVVLVTAAPQKVARAFSALLRAESIGSRTRLGCITNDLLGKKVRVYELLESQNRHVRTIYSDSHLDFWGKARKNILVGDSRLRIVRK